MKNRNNAIEKQKTSLRVDELTACVNAISNLCDEMMRIQGVVYCTAGSCLHFVSREP